MSYQRTYRQLMQPKDLVGFRITLSETDLYIFAEKDLANQAEKVTMSERRKLKAYIRSFPQFQTTWAPMEVAATAPPIVKLMAQAGQKAGTGPMAAVAGAMAQQVGLSLLSSSEELIVENGGDIFLSSKKDRKIGLYAGDSPFSNKLALRIYPEQTPLGICTSAGQVGPSSSLGNAHGVVILSQNTALADAVATATGNLVKKADDIDLALDFAQNIPGVMGVVIALNQHLGIWGQIELVPIS